MTSEWVAPTFTLAGSALAGSLGLVAGRMQRWQVKHQIQAASESQAADNRRQAYISVMAAFTEYNAAWWHEFNRRRSANEVGPVDVSWAALHQALAAVYILGPSMIAKQADLLGDAVRKLESELSGPDADLERSAEECWQRVYEVSWQFTILAREALGLE